MATRRVSRDRMVPTHIGQQILNSVKSNSVQLCFYFLHILDNKMAAARLSNFVEYQDPCEPRLGVHTPEQQVR